MQFRPEHDPRIGDDQVDWEDNWLSNGLAWASYRFTPAWCQTPEHFSSRVAQYLFTDCPCCAIWRGLALGYFIGFAIGVTVTVTAVLITALIFA